MHRRFLKEVRDVFPKSVDEYSQQVERLLQHRRAELNATWEGLEQGWNENNECMAKLGVRPRTNAESVFKLNVGGSNVTVSWHLLMETEGFEDSILAGLLEGVWGENRIPRDADGIIMLDESPACIKYIVHAMLTGRSNSAALGLPERASPSAMAADEAACLTYTAHVMGLLGSVPTHPKYMRIHGGSTILEPFELAPFGATIRKWVGGSLDEMTLIYRATRDGFGSKECIARCRGSPNTVSLLRVSSGQGNSSDDDSVVGGYACVPWGGMIGSKQCIVKEAFVCRLKDGGSAAQKDAPQPTKWHPETYDVGKEFEVRESDGPYFCACDFVTIFDKVSGCCTIKVQDEGNFPTGSGPLLALDGKKVVEIEIYRCPTPEPPATTAPSATEPGGDNLAEVEAQDTHSFGKSIASSLMEERVVLNRAVKEMEAAGARVSAAVGALKAVYGPSVAAGEQDAVVELNVRGTRMTTLRSTLRACPRSALAAMFNEDRWPATDKDKDEHGRRLIDCNPTCFAKILDVLRMRKRASWSRVATPEKQEGSSAVLPGGVLFKAGDTEAFNEAVNMYFPGCENFITDLMEPI